MLEPIAAAAAAADCVGLRVDDGFEVDDSLSGLVDNNGNGIDEVDGGVVNHLDGK